MLDGIQYRGDGWCGTGGDRIERRWVFVCWPEILEVRDYLGTVIAWEERREHGIDIWERNFTDGYHKHPGSFQ